MKFNSIINRYIFLELIPPFLLCLSFFTFILMMATILDITDMVVNYKISIETVLLLLTYSMPKLLQYIIPMSVMMSVLLTLLRMSSDNEIIALKSGGASAWALLPPVLFFSLAGCLLSGHIAIYGEPWGATSLKYLLIDIASTNVNIGLKERTFNDSFEGVTLYVSEKSNNDQSIKDVFIEDQREKGIVVTVIAPKGKFTSDPASPVSYLTLYDGIINQVSIDKKSVHTINFKTYDIRLDHKNAPSEEKQRAQLGQKKQGEMSLAYLWEYINNPENAKKHPSRYAQLLMKFHKKFSIPFSCIVLGFLAVPLGMHSMSARKSYGLGLGLIVFLIYYLILSSGLFLGEMNVCPPLLAVWLPDIIMAAVGIYLFRRTLKERPVNLDFITSFVNNIARRLTGKL